MDYGWLVGQHASGDLGATSRQAFAVGTNEFEVEGPGLPRSVAVMDLGMGLRSTLNSDLSLSTNLLDGG